MLGWDAVTDEEADKGWQRVRAAEACIGCGLQVRGDLAPLGRPTVSVVTSRRSKRVSGHEAWIRQILEVERLTRFRGGALVSSLGTLSYELAAWARARAETPLVLVRPAESAGTEASQSAQRARDYGAFLVPSTVEIRPRPGAPGTERLTPAYRDRLIDALSDAIVGIEIRSGGNWHQILEERLARGGKVYCVTTEERPGLCHEQLLELGAIPLDIGIDDSARPEPAVAPPSSPWNEDQPTDSNHLEGYLFHYTRRRAGPWPDQHLTEYLDELILRAPGAAHTGLDALGRILSSRVILASRRLIRGGASVCCFTDRGPHEMRELARWSPGQTRWNFEPYAVGFRREYAERKRIQQVLHLPPEQYAGLSSEDRFRYQRLELETSDWRAEGEWRVEGDFDFRDARVEDVVVLMPARHAAWRATIATPFRTILLQGDWPSHEKEF